MPNAWVEHVRQYAKDNNLTYACAIPYAKESYTKKDGTKSTPSKSLPAPKPEPKAKPKATPKPEPKAKAKAKTKTKKQIKEEEEDRLREQRSKEKAESDERHRKLIERLDKEKQKRAEKKFEEGVRESDERKMMLNEDPIQQRINKQKDDERIKKMKAEKEAIQKSHERSMKIMKTKYPEMFREPIREYFKLAEQYYKMLEPTNILESLKGATTNEAINARIKQFVDESNGILEKMRQMKRNDKNVETNMNEAEQQIINKHSTANRAFKKRINTALRKHSLTLM